MEREFPTVPFERYADDVICHCVSEKQAKYLLGCIKQRLAECRLDDRSRMSREAQVRFCEGVGVRFPRATRLKGSKLDQGHA